MASKGSAGMRKHNRQYRSPAHQKYISHGTWLEHKLANAAKHPESLTIRNYDAEDRMHPYKTKRVTLAEYTEWAKKKMGDIRNRSAAKSKGRT